ncbi:DUF4349 domain-containing protein [Nonomuraea jiangxiensis]|uniref:DUF4349 domain-containing protein n=1 Tax=Nonomuraea jiangxiensis TaxID=633440 RepID=A0A1G8C4J4_9ACTN|nr:DUF4349 domain-containing protein [Nonomuraea jiangxiensis]SDH40407.1 protein of unknown function [Nonomuraea jiangxiensis]
MRRIRYGIVLSAASAAVLLAGCGGGSSLSGAADYDAAAPAQAPALAAESATSQKALPTAQARDQGGGGKDGGIVSNVEVTQQQRQVIYIGTMAVRAKQVSTAVQQAKGIVTAAGGYLSKEETSSADDSQDTATLEFKIPPDKYAAVVGRLGKDLGEQVSMNQGTEDVTLKVADVESRLKSAQRSLESLRELMKRADTIGQVLEVEREISSREADLESLQAQQKELAAQVSMATLTLQLVGPAAVIEEPEEEPAGFLGGLKTGWDSLVSFTRGLLTLFGVLLPWMIFLLPVMAVIVFLTRRNRTRPSLLPATASPSGPRTPPQPHRGEQAPESTDDQA